MSAPQMDESSRKELEQFLQVEQQKARFQQQVHTFTDTCWDKCMTGKVGSKLDRSEEACLGNCVERYLDTGVLLMKRLQDLSSQ